MAEIIATVTVEITHHDGTITSVTKSAHRRTGDNPRFLAHESITAVSDADRHVIDAIRAIHGDIHA